MSNYNNTAELKQLLIKTIENNNLDDFSLKDLLKLLNIDPNKSNEQLISKALKQIGYKSFLKNYSEGKRRVWSKDTTIPEILLLEKENIIYIYFILDKDNMIVKIGISNNPSYRLNQLVTGNPFELTIIGKIKGSQKEEKYLHNYFKEFNKKNEWFYYTNEFRDKLLTYLLNREELFK